MKEFIGKKVKIIYSDGLTSQGGEHYSKKEGLVLSVTETHLVLKIGGFIQAINLTKILRVEVKQNE